jgi:deoxyribodipyrimidine photolyase-related protein
MKRKIQSALLIFPNSLFPDIKAVNYDKVFVIEEPLFFKPSGYQINKIKLAYFRASMRYFYDQLTHENKEYIDYCNVGNYEFAQGYEIEYYDTVDWNLELKIKNLVPDFQKLESPLFLLKQSECTSYFEKPQKRFVQQRFFEFVKKKFGVLEHVGSMDHENRKPLPKNHKFTFDLPFFTEKDYYQEAQEYIDHHQEFASNLGSTEEVHRYPIHTKAAQAHFMDFLTNRVANFGPYEDAIDKNEQILFHSFCSVPLNVGILSPKWVLDTIMATKNVPLNSLEGFVRQLIGWREYQRAIYVSFPNLSKSNYFGHNRKLRWEYWNGEKLIGIPILDNEIKKALKLGYSHHITRLTIFLNIFNLLGVGLEDIVQWFSQIICMDAYPWVMYSNIATMGYFDTRFMQKPYITASAYLLKMSNYEKGKWCDLWNALFYNFLFTNKEMLKSGSAIYLRNLSYFEKKNDHDKNLILRTACEFINKVTL